MGGTTFVAGGDGGEYGYVDVVPEVAAQLSSGVLVSREKVEEEIDMILRTLRTIWEMEPDQAMRLLAAVSSRCTELSVHLHRLDTRYREWRQVRTMQVDKVLLECDRQFKIASRLLEARRQDLDLMKG